MGALEARLVIKAVDETAAAFASAEARVHALSRAVATGGGAINAVGASAGRMASADRAIQASGTMMGTIAGAARQAAGFAMAYGAGVAVHEAAKAVAARQHELVRMTVSGMSRGEISDATAEAAKLAMSSPNVSMTDTMHLLRNARSIVGTYEEAAAIAEPMLKLRTLAQLARPGQDVSEDFDQLIKGLEIKGVTQNHHEFMQYMEGIAKGLNVFGDTLKPYQYYEMFKYGRQATSGLSEHFILSTAPTLAQELGGSSYGQAVSAFNKAIVGGVMKHSALKEFARLGLVDAGDLDYVKTGEIKGLKPGKGIKGWQVAQADPNAWVRDYLLPALDKLGLKDRADVMKEVSSLFQNQVAGQMVSLLATQQSRIEKDAALIEKAPGLSAADRVLREDPVLAWQALKSSLESLTAALLQSVNAADMMTTAAMGFASFTRGLEEETKAQREGRNSPGQDRINRWLNRNIFGVDTSDMNTAINEGSAALEDRRFGAKARGYIARGDALQAIIDNSSGDDRRAARAELDRLRDEARAARDEWRNIVRQRGEDAFAEREALDGRYGRGHVRRAVPRIDDYINEETRKADARAFAPPQQVEVRGEAQSTVIVRVEPSSELLRIPEALRTLQQQISLNPVQGGHTGTMNSDAAPVVRGPHRAH